MVRKCTRCFAKYTQDFAFCPKCGGALEIDPDWLSEQEREKAKAREDEERRARQSEFKDRISEITRNFPDFFVINGKLFAYNCYNVLSMFNGIKRELGISEQVAINKLQSL